MPLRPVPVGRHATAAMMRAFRRPAIPHFRTVPSAPAGRARPAARAFSTAASARPALRGFALAGVVGLAALAFFPQKARAEAPERRRPALPAPADYAEIGARLGSDVEREYGKKVPDTWAYYVVEKTTNRPIPVSLTTPDGERFSLVGYGAKRVTFLAVAVYAFAIYASEDSLRGWKELSRVEGPESVDDAAVRGLLAGEVAVRIEPVRSTTGSHLFGALQRHLLPTFPSPLPPAIQSALSQFSSLFPRLLPEGSELVMAARGGELRMSVDGRAVGSVKSEEVADGVMWGYLKREGANVKDARESMGDVVAWIAGRAK
ncbi:chalcone-flavanone isomerase-domain-containing protein [Hyaloraphidium curvatum]|nr:chalcone-flavanone isomerase-domain-containing protein [Hyaloraphidium curvatum]